MSYINKLAPARNFTKVCNIAMVRGDLSEGARVLYWFLCSTKPGKDYSDKYVMKVLGVSQKTLTRRKKELKIAELMIIEEIGIRRYVCYLGGGNKTAAEVKYIINKQEEGML